VDKNVRQLLWKRNAYKILVGELHHFENLGIDGRTVLKWRMLRCELESSGSG
jgi:hypothetical protein